MINLINITEHKPDIILRGEFGIANKESVIIAPNAKNGKIVVMIDDAKQIAAIAHFDSSEKVNENIDLILQDMKSMGAEIKDIKCSIMEKNEEKSFLGIVQKSFKEKVQESLQSNGNEQQIGHTSWSGNDFCNVVLKGNGDLLIDNSRELMRAAMNLLMFTVEGDNRLKNALDPALITDLKKVKSSKVTNNEVEIIKTDEPNIIKQTPSTVFLKLSAVSAAVFGKKNKNENSGR